MTLKGNLIVGVRSFPGNRYDDHTMYEQIEQSKILMQSLGVKPEVVYADLGYRGVDKDNPDVEIKYRGKDKRFTDEERRQLKRRQAIEPIIGHLKEPTSAWIAASSKGHRAMRYKKCCVRRATTSAGCCA